MQRLIIVGGGYAGATLAEALDGTFEVTLIGPKDRFVHCVGAIRAVVQPALRERIMIPYDRLLRHGSVVQGRATDIGDGYVRLADGQIVEGDWIVVATGSSYAAPFKAGISTQAFIDQHREAHSALWDAGSVAIIGGGAVGVELAGEIASAFPQKAVSLIAASAQLLPGYAPKLSATLADQLAARDVAVTLGVRVSNPGHTDRPFSRPVMANGRPIDADLVFPALGAKPQPPPLSAATIAPSGRIVVDPWLRPLGHPRIFALGDVAETGDPMTIVAITRQAPWLIKALKALVDDRAVETLSACTPWQMRGILVPLGPHGGASVLPLGRNGVMAGRRAARPRGGPEIAAERLLAPRATHGRRERRKGRDALPASGILQRQGQRPVPPIEWPVRPWRPMSIGKFAAISSGSSVTM